jgi:hypothetical protein
MSVVLSNLLANGEVVDQTPSMDNTERATEDLKRVLQACLTADQSNKKRKIDTNSEHTALNLTTTVKQENGSGSEKENENENEGQPRDSHTTNSKVAASSSSPKQAVTHGKSNTPAKPLRAVKGNSVCFSCDFRS